MRPEVTCFQPPKSEKTQTRLSQPPLRLIQTRRFPCLLHRLWWPLSNLEEQLEEAPLKPLGSACHNHAFSRWHRQMRKTFENFFVLHCQSRQQGIQQARPRHSFPRNLEEGSQPIWGQVNQHSIRGSASPWLIISPENMLFSSLWFINSRTSCGPASAPLCWDACVFSLKSKDPEQWRLPQTPINLPHLEQVKLFHSFINQHKYNHNAKSYYVLLWMWERKKIPHSYLII